MPVLFGVKSTNLEESARWVEQAIGLTAEPRESISFGGDYYGFSGLHGEIVRLLVNKDVYDGEPVVAGADSWIVVVTLENAPDNSPLTKSLIADAQHFQML